MNTAISAIHAATIAVFCSSAIFLVGYSLMAKWWRYYVGRAVASLDACLVVATLPTILHLIFSFNVINLFFAWYDFSSLVLVTLVTLWRLATIHHVQITDHHHHQLVMGNHESHPEPCDHVPEST